MKHEPYDFLTIVDVYQYLINGGTIQNKFPGNEVTIRIVDNQFCRLNNSNEWVKYSLDIGNPMNWSILSDS